MESNYNILVEEASKSPFNNQMAAIIVKNHQVVSKGHNHDERANKAILRTYRFFANDYSVHAEVDALMNLIRTHPSYFERGVARASSSKGNQLERKGKQSKRKGHQAKRKDQQFSSGCYASHCGWQSQEQQTVP